MWLVGSCYNFVWAHRTLGEERTPAMAAEITDHRWSMEELLTFPGAARRATQVAREEAAVAVGGRGAA